MKLFPSHKIREWDAFSIQQHYRNSAELMEEAAQTVVFELQNSEYADAYTIFCGTGNNGGDGLCIARLLWAEDTDVNVYIVGDFAKGSDDFKNNLKRLLETDVKVEFLSENNHRFKVDEETVVLDCIFGTGINRAVEGWYASLINNINALPNRIIATDLPSGLIPDLIAPQEGAVIRAHRTLTFEIPKRAFMFKENYDYVGDFEVLPIGLDKDFAAVQESDFLYYDDESAQEDFIPRKKFAYKNTFGHLRIIAGSKGKMGAAILSSRAAMRAGAGLVTASVPACGLDVLQTALPEAMCEADTSADVLKDISYDNKYATTAIGPGIGQAPETVLMLRRILKDAEHPLVLDADALNIIASKNLLKDIPQNSILTPHVGEFDRLFGEHENSFTRLETLRKKAAEHHFIIVLKGAHTAVALPNGTISFNSTGNVGLATAGSGDVLTGIIAAMLAQGYAPDVAACIGVYLHGLAGEMASYTKGYEGMIAGDIIDELPKAISFLSEND